MPDALRRTATVATAGGLLIFASVAAELVHPVQNPDGTSREPMLHAIYLIAWIAGWALVAATAIGLRATVAGAPRKATIGAWLVVFGAVAFAISGLGLLIGLLSGVYLEALFVLVLVAFPLVVVGCLLLGLAMRRSTGPAWVLMLVAAAGFLVALLADMDPIHDIGLLAGALAIAGAGLAGLGADRRVLERTSSSGPS